MRALASLSRFCCSSRSTSDKLALISTSCTTDRPCTCPHAPMHPPMCAFVRRCVGRGGGGEGEREEEEEEEEEVSTTRRCAVCDVLEAGVGRTDLLEGL
jgi:hypothetical protein